MMRFKSLFAVMVSIFCVATIVHAEEKKPKAKESTIDEAYDEIVKQNKGKPLPPVKNPSTPQSIDKLQKDLNQLSKKPPTKPLPTPPLKAAAAKPLPTPPSPLATKVTDSLKETDQNMSKAPAKDLPKWNLAKAALTDADTYCKKPGRDENECSKRANMALQAFMKAKVSK